MRLPVAMFWVSVGLTMAFAIGGIWLGDARMAGIATVFGFFTFIPSFWMAIDWTNGN